MERIPPNSQKPKEKIKKRRRRKTKYREGEKKELPPPNGSPVIRFLQRKVRRRERKKIKEKKIDHPLTCELSRSSPSRFGLLIRRAV
jgi:hypothetical protein